MKKFKFRPLFKSLIAIALFLEPSGFVSSQEAFVDYPQFLNSEFLASRVKMKAGKDLNLIMNYNLVTEKMVFLQKDQVYDLLNQGFIDTIYMGNKKFITHEKVFFEVHPGEPSTLFVQHRGRLMSPPKPAGYGGTSELSSSTYMNRVEMGSQVYNMKLEDALRVKYDPLYWVQTKDNMVSFVNEKQFLKIFPGKEDAIKQYIKKNKLKFEKLDDIIKIWSFSNNLIK
jgi:hypothetical protein